MFREMFHLSLVEGAVWAAVAGFCFFYLHWWVVSMFLFANGLVALSRAFTYRTLAGRMAIA